MMPDNKMISTHRNHWREILTDIQSTPLDYCPNFPEIARRWNQWWQFQSDRPLIIAQVATDHNIRWDKGFDLLDIPEAWMQHHLRQLEQTHFAGDALPSIRVDIGPVATAAFLGAPLHFSVSENTSWQTPLIDSWDNFQLQQNISDNDWYKKVLSLMERLAEIARGKFLVCLPDLTGAIDVIANLRTSQRLCYDLYEHREEILKTASMIVDAWEEAFVEMYKLVLGAGTGITQWVTCWADVPFTVPTCDFNALIGPHDFREVCLPSLKDQAQRAGLCVLHLDGPQAARHAETLAVDPDITAIQYTPGAGTPSALEKLPMFKLFHAHKVPLFIETPVHEVRELVSHLDPRGLALRVSGLKSPAEADELIRWRDVIS